MFLYTLRLGEEATVFTNIGFDVERKTLAKLAREQPTPWMMRRSFAVPSATTVARTTPTSEPSKDGSDDFLAWRCNRCRRGDVHGLCRSSRVSVTVVTGIRNQSLLERAQADPSARRGDLRWTFGQILRSRCARDAKSRRSRTLQSRVNEVDRMACAKDNTELAADEIAVAEEVDFETAARDVAKNIGSWLRHRRPRRRGRSHWVTVSMSSSSKTTVSVSPRSLTSLMSPGRPSHDDKIKLFALLS